MGLTLLPQPSFYTLALRKFQHKRDNFSLVLFFPSSGSQLQEVGNSIDLCIFRYSGLDGPDAVEFQQASVWHQKMCMHKYFSFGRAGYKFYSVPKK